MAFHDYELIHTKRVVRERRGTNLYKRRRWEATGGWASWYFASILGCAGYSLFYKNAAPSQYGFATKVLLPAFVGYAVLGIGLYGSYRDTFRLLNPFGEYAKDLKRYQRDMFYQ